jgi:hypothetical protein
MRRRDFLTGVVSVPAVVRVASSAGTPPPRQPKLAAIVVGYALRWHADNIVTRLLEGYWIDQKFHPPRCRVVSLYTHRRGASDVSSRLAAAYDFKVYPTISGALTRGTRALDVDGVVLVSEAPGILVPFGENPFHEFLHTTIDVFRASGRSVPVFNDKQFSSRWEDSRWFYDQSKQLGFPLLAGSVIPVTFRRPELDLPLETPIQEAVVVAAIPLQHLQSTTFHAMELLQSFVERRRGGETGIRSLHLLEGDAVWQAAADGRWSNELFDAAVATSLTRTPGPREKLVTRPLALLVTYRDGFKAAVIGAAGMVGDFNFAARIRGRSDPVSTLAYFVGENGNSFSCLVEQVENLMLTRQSPIPAERTLLASGVIDWMMRSREQKQPVETPELGINYRAPAESVFCRGAGS